jgi:hypothetical protein
MEPAPLCASSFGATIIYGRRLPSGVFASGTQIAPICTAASRANLSGVPAQIRRFWIWHPPALTHFIVA